MEDMYNQYPEEIYWYVTNHYLDEWQASGLSIAEFVHSDFERESEVYAFCLGY